MSSIITNPKLNQDWKTVDSSVSPVLLMSFLKKVLLEPETNLIRLSSAIVNVFEQHHSHCPLRTFSTSVVIVPFSLNLLIRP